MAFCSAVTLCFAAICAVVSAALLAIAFSTDNWQVISVDREKIRVSIMYSNDTNDDIHRDKRCRSKEATCGPWQRVEIVVGTRQLQIEYHGAGSIISSSHLRTINFGYLGCHLVLSAYPGPRCLADRHERADWRALGGLGLSLGEIWFLSNSLPLPHLTRVSATNFQHWDGEWSQ